jgi:hypothetical protein
MYPQPITEAVAERHAEDLGRIARFRNEPQCNNTYLRRIAECQHDAGVAKGLWLYAAAWKRGWFSADARIKSG